MANLPYSVPRRSWWNWPSARAAARMVATLQLEVARRLMAKAGEPDYGVLTLLVQLDYEPRGWFKIPASCFFPEPEVDSACVVLVRRRAAAPCTGATQRLLTIVKRSFSQRRKMMVKLLKADWSAADLESAFAHIGPSLQARAETSQPRAIC